VVAGGIDASGRRIAVVSAGGFWRWAFRGGAGAVAAPAVWGALFDWLADAPPSVGRTITLADAFVRSGAPIHWRGVLGGDTLARVRLRHRPSGDPVSLTLRRDTTAGDLRSDSPLPGVYDLDSGGVLVVNASAELLPRRATLRSGSVGAELGPQSAPTSSIPLTWPLALATLLLCGEWVARRRLGLR
ncbi:MAG: hypothetical protein M3154_03435, partial [Candidatus Eremiobacteraeota bacterium]|nr:hypothetical protein [Candidatus Eremiobacteraeota bacterium]